MLSREEQRRRMLSREEQRRRRSAEPAGPVDVPVDVVDAIASIDAGERGLVSRLA